MNKLLYAVAALTCFAAGAAADGTATQLANGLIFTQAGGTRATDLAVTNENNNENIDYDPRGYSSYEFSDTDHSPHFGSFKARGTAAAPTGVQVGDYLSGYVAHAYIPGDGFVRSGYFAHYVKLIGTDGFPVTNADIKSAWHGQEYSVFHANPDAAATFGDSGFFAFKLDASGYAPIQGKLTTDTAFAPGEQATPTGSLILYDANGRAFLVNAAPAP